MEEVARSLSTPATFEASAAKLPHLSRQLFILCIVSEHARNRFFSSSVSLSYSPAILLHLTLSSDDTLSHAAGYE